MPRLDCPSVSAETVYGKESPGFGDYRSFRSGELAGELALSLAMASLQQARILDSHKGLQ